MSECVYCESDVPGRARICGNCLTKLRECDRLDEPYPDWAVTETTTTINHDE